MRSFNKAANVSGQPDMDFTQFELSGEVLAGEEWTIIVDNVPKTVTAVANDTLQTIAERLVTAIGSEARYNQYLDLYVIFWCLLYQRPCSITVI